MSEGAPLEWIDGCVAAHATLLRDIHGLTDDAAHRPSALPGWSVGHVLTHIARNADSVVRRLEGAARGEVLDQYAGGAAGRAAAIEEGAHRPAAALVADVRDSAAMVERAMSSLPEAAWDRLSRAVDGQASTSRRVVFSRWREVVVHHRDLALEGVVVPFLPALVAEWLPDELARLTSRTDNAALLAWLLGRGRAPELEPW